MNFNNVEEFVAARQQFFESHPEAPEAKDIECLNLIMKKEFAEQIIAGTKKLEFRAYSNHYVSRLIDKDVSAYIQRHINDDKVITFCNDIRQVKMIHFHNYENSWILDVECDFNDVFCINKQDIDFLHEKYNCHDFDDDLARFEAMKAEQRPYIFYFVCGKIIKRVGI